MKDRTSAVFLYKLLRTVLSSVWFFIMVRGSLNPEILKYILREIFVKPIDGEISRALTQNDFFNHLDVLNMSSEDMETLTFMNDSDEEVNITSEQHKEIKYLQAYIAFSCRGKIPKFSTSSFSYCLPSKDSSYTLTKSKHAAVFLHIIVKFLNDSIEEEIAQALTNHGFKRLTDILCMSIEAIEKFSLTQEDKVRIHSLHDYLCYHNIHPCNIILVTDEDYKAFYAEVYDSRISMKFTFTPSPITSKTT